MDQAKNRRIPTQQRAKERVEHLLKTAESIIIEGGISALTTNGLAARAAVPVGSFYQYFPGIEGIIGALVERYHRALEEEVVRLFDGIDDADSFLEGIKVSQQLAWNFLLSNRGYRELWCGAQTWTPLRQSDWQDTLKNAETIDRALRRVFPKLDPAKSQAFCIMVCDASGSMARMAIEFPELQNALRTEWLSMITARFLEFSQIEAEVTVTDGR